MSIMFWSHSDAFDQELRRLLLSNLPIPAWGSSGNLPVPGRHYNFQVIFIHHRCPVVSARKPDRRKRAGTKSRPPPTTANAAAEIKFERRSCVITPKPG